ncbi:MAG: sensor domain-containing protein [Austwickia sp.]|jgi:signal transduction histidine kinase|nr:sensor domain-containing protein [Austwickia sp.]MBK8436995.1 sensor domain-containing protein [Austwickia sp.]MBK9100622.1 sensor domain-containing protein [Austwickia sp.]
MMSTNPERPGIGPELGRVQDVVRPPADAQAPAQAPVPARPADGWWQRWRAGWSHLAFLVLDLPVAIAGTLVVSFVIAGVAALPALGFGLVFLIPTLWAAGALGHLERLRIEAFTGVVIPPRTADPATPSWRALALSPTRWRATAYFALQLLWGYLVGATVLSALAVCLTTVAMPLFAGAVATAGWTILDVVTVTWLPAQVVVWLAAVAGVVVLPFVAPALSAVDVHLARWLLGQDQTRRIEQLSSRVDTLTHTRTAAVDSAEAERRRIERDLHDGPQQRLVSIAMDLGMAKAAMGRDPAAAQSLIDHAHASSKEAIVEMRQVARGIAPPILTDRGLDAALSALAARAGVPVRVEVGELGRLDPTLEAIAYFCVSEALTNVTKHARASAAQVRVERVRSPAAPGAVPRSQIVVTVSDDGVGGADPLTGTGLTGLRQRLSAVDGTLTVFSPPGGPTVLTAVLPESAARPSSDVVS